MCWIWDAEKDTLPVWWRRQALSRYSASMTVSLIPAYERLPPEYLACYLRHEFCFFLSQGCKYQCTFCAAVRTRRDSRTGKMIAEKDAYRDLAVAKADLDYLVKRALDARLPEMQIYLSNLDLCQGSERLGAFAEAVSEVRAANCNFPLVMRGLSTVSSFMYAHRHRPDVIRRIRDAGLVRIGFGVDGSTAALWKATKKPNKEDECLRALALTREEYGLTPETLMVFGHNDHDTRESLELAYTFSRDMQDKYGAEPRPHVAKSVIPGNDGWSDVRSASLVRQLLSTPSLFQALDFTALASTITHPDAELRATVNRYFLAVCGLSSNRTQFVKPVEPWMTAAEIDMVRSFNEGKYDI